LSGTILVACLHHPAAPSAGAYMHANQNMFLRTVPFMAVSLFLDVLMWEKRSRRK
jgi:hypothetical protein